jgi:hypothetical protein
VTDTTMRDTAVKLAAAGRPVIPLHGLTVDGRCTCRRPGCASPGKHPRTTQGVTDASAEPATVAAWWRRWPHANVGLATGSGTGLVVVDLDGDEGAEAFAALQRRHGPLPDTRWARTGSGGWHAYFRHPGGAMPNTARRLGPGIDTRGDGGYVVAPPSLHASGGRYAWHNRARLAPMPGWLVELLRPPAPAPRRPVRLRGHADAYSAAALDRECKAVASTPPGGRNHALNAAAFALGTLVASGRLDASDVRAALLGAALSAGLGEIESERTIASGITAGARHPREVAS